MATMKHTIVVRDPATYEPQALLEGSECPEWAVPLVHPDELDDAAEAKPKPRTGQK